MHNPVMNLSFDQTMYALRVSFANANVTGVRFNYDYEA